MPPFASAAFVLLLASAASPFDNRGPKPAAAPGPAVDAIAAPFHVCVISGYVYFDHSENGTWNPGVDPLEVPIAGWRVEIRRNGVFDGFTFTDSGGRYVFNRLQVAATIYTIEEKAPGGYVGDNIPGAIWVATTPRSGQVVPNAPVVPGPDFGNLSFELRTGVGRTPEFWAAGGGDAVLAQNDPQWRHDLYDLFGAPVCLRTPHQTSNPTTSLFIPPFPVASGPVFFMVPYQAARNTFDSWTRRPPQDHAGYLLSLQVAATILNRTTGFIQFTAYIDRFQNGVLVSLDAMLAGATGLLCQPGAGLTGPRAPAQYQALRQTMLNCINEFGTINNTGDLGEPQTVYGSSLEPADFSSPY